MVHFLEVPLVRAGLQIERDDRCGEEVVPAALRPIVVGAGVARGDIDQAELRIDRGLRPDRTAAVRPRVALPCLVTLLARTGHRPELPHLLAGLRVVGPELTAAALIATGDADVYKAVVIGRRRTRVALARGRQLCLPDERARTLIERDERIVTLTGEDLSLRDDDTTVRRVTSRGGRVLPANRSCRGVD